MISESNIFGNGKLYEPEDIRGETIMKLKRTKKNYGSGSGRSIFESDLFSVTIWKCQKGTKTTLEIVPFPFYREDRTITFDGKHELTSDSLCLEQLTAFDLYKLIKVVRKRAIEEGKKIKAKEIRDCLQIENF